MKYRSVDAQLFDDMVKSLTDIISYSETMIVPSVKKEELLNEGRAVLERARKQDYKPPIAQLVGRVKRWPRKTLFK